MSISTTLHVIATPYRYWAGLIDQLKALWQTGDAVLLLSEGVQGWQDNQLEGFAPVYILDTDTLLASIHTDLPQHLVSVDHQGWAELVLNHTKCMTWR